MSIIFLNESLKYQEIVKNAVIFAVIFSQSPRFNLPMSSKSPKHRVIQFAVIEWEENKNIFPWKKLEPDHFGILLKKEPKTINRLSK